MSYGGMGGWETLRAFRARDKLAGHRLARGTAKRIMLAGLKVALQLGSKRYNIAPGSSTSLKVKLAKGSRRLAGRNGRLKVRARSVLAPTEHPLLGEHNVANLVAAAAAGVEMKVGLDQVALGLVGEQADEPAAQRLPHLPALRHQRVE